MARKMSFSWWNYAKLALKRYPLRQDAPFLDADGRREQEAVKAMLHKIEGEYRGDEKLKFIDMVFFKKTHTIAGAANKLYISESLAKLWHRDIIYYTGKFLIGDFEAGKANINSSKKSLDDFP